MGSCGGERALRATIGAAALLSACSAGTGSGPEVRIDPLPGPSGTSAAPVPISSAPQAELRDSRFFEIGHTWLFLGWIENTGHVPIDWPVAQVTLVDAAGAEVEGGPCNSALHVLPPGAKAPCSFGTFMAAPFTGHRVELHPVRSRYRGHPAILHVEESQIVRHGALPLRLEGTVSNGGPASARDVWVLAAVFDRTEKIAGVEQARIDGDLAPGARAAFALELSSLADAPYLHEVQAIGETD